MAQHPACFAQTQELFDTSLSNCIQRTWLSSQHHDSAHRRITCTQGRITALRTVPYHDGTIARAAQTREGQARMKTRAYVSQEMCQAKGQGHLPGCQLRKTVCHVRTALHTHALLHALLAVCCFLCIACFRPALCQGFPSVKPQACLRMLLQAS